MNKKLAFVLVGLVFSFSVVSSAKAAGNADEGKKIYEGKCQKCHGEKGAGDGRSAKKLDTKPTALNDPSIFTDKKKTPDLEPEARIRLAITKGGEAVKQSKEMDAFTNLTPAQVDDVVAFIKTFKK